MNVLKIAIADPEKNFRELLESHIHSEKNMEVIGTADDGWELLNIIRKENPDALVMDLALKNGLVLLPCVREKTKSLKILALSKKKNDIVVPPTSELEISFFSKATYPADDLVQRILETLKAPPSPNEDGVVELQISVLLRQFGIPVHMKGYQYLRKAVKIVMEDPESIGSVTKILYPDIAKYYGTAASCVERAMRSAIEAAWDRRDPAFPQGHPGRALLPKMGRPTNSEFIMAVVNALYLQQKNPELTS